MIARCVILRSAQVNGTAIFIQLRVVDSLNKFCVAISEDLMNIIVSLKLLESLLDIYFL